MRRWKGVARLRPLVDGFVFRFKATRAERKVGWLSIFMKLALCEIGFCLMHPCMDGLLQKTPELPVVMLEAKKKDEAMFESFYFSSYSV